MTALAGCASSSGGFTDITQESGVGQIIQDKYQRSPKWWMFGFSVVDLDGDGNLDLYFGSHSFLSHYARQAGMTEAEIDRHDGGPAVIALGDGKGHFTLAKGIGPDKELNLAYDVDGDGKLDINARDRDGSGRWWLNHSQSGYLNYEPTTMFAGEEQGRGGCMIDIDGDGKVDWIHPRPLLVVERGDGKGHFSKAAVIGVPGAREDTGFSVMPADFDGDGKIDLLLGWGGYGDPAGNIRLLQGDGKMNFTDVTDAVGLPRRGSLVDIGDFDQNGSTDVLILDSPTNLALYLNDGRGHFTKKENAFGGPIETKYMFGMAAVTDFDNDGVADVLVSVRSALHMYRGLGGGRFADVTKTWKISELGFDCRGLGFGDFNGDGMLDLLAYTNFEPLRVGVFRNDLPRKNYLNVRPVGSAGNKGAAGAKIRIYEAGHAGDPSKLLWYEQVSIWTRNPSKNYYDFGQTERHFGLGQRQAVDVSVEFYPGGKLVEQKGVNANRTIVIEEKQ